MFKKHSSEITSTEKLLNIIRKKDYNVEDNTIIRSNIPGAGKGLKPSAKKPTSPYKTVTIGVDIGHNFLRLVKTTRSSDNKWKLLDYKCVPINSPAHRETSEFAGFLKSEISAFCNSLEKKEIWAVISAARVNIRHIKIPMAAKKQVENAVLWAVRKEEPFDEKEAILDFEIRGEIIEQGVPKLLVMAYTAPRYEIEEMKKLFSKIEFPLIGISTAPFAIQNIFRSKWVPSLKETIATLFIGNNHSRIDIYADGNLVMTRGIKAGASSMIESLVEMIDEGREVASGTDNNRVPINMKQAQKIFFSLSPDYQPLTEKDAGYGFKKEDIFKMVLPALERLVRQVERTFEHYTVNLKNEKVRKIYISGVMNGYTPLIDYIGSQLDVESEVFDPLAMQGSSAPVFSDIKSLAISDKVAFAPALGIALSSNDYTSNMLFTYKDKKEKVNIARFNRSVLAVFIAAALICSAIFMYQVNALGKKKAVLAKIEKQLSEQNIPMDENAIMQMVSHINRQKSVLKEYRKRYTGMAVISELSAITPQSIRLINLKVNLGSTVSGEKTKEGVKKEQAAGIPAKETAENVLIDGIVLGERNMLESDLYSYIMKLESSPIFSGINVQKSNLEPHKNGDILHFTINMKIS
ncbi:MAG: hypothetical protein A2073_08010 [Deltaproteobacteria bacterium GWC2_42_11]|nr:MAG: hypothetical protein A2073_08010 [Deltaproteobacteria bacterium GWC2_42_11]HBO85311.1 hypothetical protein [Deltaproteobacteria bacterium]